MRTSSHDRRRSRLVETPAKAVAGVLAPEILEVISLVAEILLDQQRRQADRRDCRHPTQTQAREQGDDGKAA